MASDERRHILPLEPINLSAVPLTTHNIAWSPDAELALGSDDCIYLYFPEFPSKGTSSSPTSLADFDTQRQYYEIALRFPVVELRAPNLNRPLFDEAKQEYPDFESTFGAGVSVVANIGSSFNHVVALEWSPNGLGRMKRSVLAVLTGSGALTIYCEGLSDGIGLVKIKGRNIRTIRSWVVPWGVGGNLLLPRARDHTSPYSKELISAFSWAKDLGGSWALLAYVNDEGEIVIVSVQSRHSSTGKDGNAGQWRVEEVARFMGNGPHRKNDPTDPDYSPSGSSFSLRWSPWLQKSGSKSAILSYTAKNYVGFRQISIKGRSWKHMETPKIEMQKFDCSGICLYLGPDAFVTWEDLIWTKGTQKECRGIIATPSKAQAFQVAFDDTVAAETHAEHATDDCGTTYPSEEEADSTSNPISGLIIHAPNISQQTPSPYFSLTRLSATPTNFDWYQTNLPLASNPEESNPNPRWMTEISKVLEVTQPFSLAYRYQNPDGSFHPQSDGEGSDAENEGDESEDEDEEDDFEHDDGEFYKAELLQELDPLEDMEKVHTTRVRIWGMTSSPGGGVTAVFTTLTNTIKPERYTFGGLRCKILFGRNLVPVDEAYLSTRKLSTEGRMFEWMYGGGPRVPGVGNPGESDVYNTSGKSGFKDMFRSVASQQLCVFCGGGLDVQDTSAKCDKGHVFENCAATGVPILAPGISNTCGVCGMKSLKPESLSNTATALAPFIAKHISSELCGGCGGKFIN